MRTAPLVVLAAVAALAVLAAGCGKSKSSTAPDPITSRTLTISLRDSTGAPVSGAFVWAAPDDGISVVGGVTNAQGLCSVTAPVGPGVAAMVDDFGVAEPGPLVAAGTFVIPGDSRPASDTIMVRLVVVTGSYISGVVLRPGPATDHSGLFVSAPDYLTGAFDESDVDGNYRFGRIPPGRWNLLYSDLAGQWIASQTVVVPTTPSVIVAPSITVNPVPPGTRLRARPYARRGPVFARRGALAPRVGTQRDGVE